MAMAICFAMKNRGLAALLVPVLAGGLASGLALAPGMGVAAGVAIPTSLHLLEVAGHNTGAIPAGISGCNGGAGAPLEVLFEVPPFPGELADVEVVIEAQHSWLGDLTVALIAPAQVRSHSLFGRVGRVDGAGCASNADLGGVYTFSDTATEPDGNLWLAAAASGTGLVLPTTYFTADSGGPDAVMPMPKTSLAATFAGLSETQAAGTWLLRVTDSAAGDSGSIHAATLRLYVDHADTLFANGFERNLVTVVEGFEDIGNLAAKGWLQSNNSEPEGTHAWFQGNSDTFPAHDGAANAYIASNFRAVGGSMPGTISSWLVTPLLAFSPDSSISFWTRTVSSGFADRLEVRLCTGWQCSDTGTGATGVGSFTSTLLTINPDLQPTDYPIVWTQYTLAAADGLPTAGQGRIAFRYHVTEAGQAGSNSDYIGLDTVQITTPSLEGHGLPLLATWSPPLTPPWPEATGAR